MPTYLKHVPTGDMYLHTPTLAERTDMLVVDTPDIAPPPTSDTHTAVVVTPAAETKAPAPKKASPKKASPKKTVKPPAPAAEVDPALADAFGEA